MSRLTHKKEDWYWKDEEFWISAENPSLEKADDIYYKLAELEDLMEEYECDTVEKFALLLDNVRTGLRQMLDNEKYQQQIIQENTELKKKLETPKFSQYQQVWYISKLGSIIGKWNYECESEDGYILNKYSYEEDKRIYRKQPKDMVFATKEQAEAKLEELNNE